MTGIALPDRIEGAVFLLDSVSVVRGVVTGSETTAAVLSSDEILCRLSVKLSVKCLVGNSGELVALTLPVARVLDRLRGYCAELELAVCDVNKR